MKTVHAGVALALLSVTAAQAFDCKTVADDVTKTICGRPELLKADDALTAAFADALKAVGPKMAKVLKADATAWDEYRIEYCDEGDDGEAKPEDLVSCLLNDTNTRIRFLTGAPDAGPGLPDAMLTQVLVGADEIYDEYMRFAAPKTDAEKAFNKLLDKELKQLRMAKKDDETSDWFEMRLAYGSPTLLSANIDLTQDQGFAHPMVSNFSINVDMTTGKPLVMADLLDKDALAKIQDNCAVQMKDYLATGEEGDDVRRDNITMTVENLDHWSFGKSDATITYIEYGMVYATTCTLSYDVLKPMIKSSFPLPA